MGYPDSWPGCNETTRGTGRPSSRDAHSAFSVLEDASAVQGAGCTALSTRLGDRAAHLDSEWCLSFSQQPCTYPAHPGGGSADACPSSNDASACRACGGELAIAGCQVMCLRSSHRLHVDAGYSTARSIFKHGLGGLQKVRPLSLSPFWAACCMLTSIAAHHDRRMGTARNRTATTHSSAATIPCWRSKTQLYSVRNRTAAAQQQTQRRRQALDTDGAKGSGRAGRGLRVYHQVSVVHICLQTRAVLTCSQYRILGVGCAHRPSSVDGAAGVESTAAQRCDVVSLCGLEDTTPRATSKSEAAEAERRGRTSTSASVNGIGECAASDFGYSPGLPLRFEASAVSAVPAPGAQKRLLPCPPRKARSRVPATP